jgi:predicted dinucleotide-binding enzyme
MRISVIGRGNVGGGLADLWERAGHDVTRLGRDGGDVGDADAVLLAMPGRAIADALGSVSGLEGKAFNINFAAIYDRIADAGERPGNLWCGDDEAREAVETLSRDAGYEPINAGPLENCAAQEQLLKLVFAVAQGGMGPFFYRMAPPDRF